PRQLALGVRPPSSTAAGSRAAQRRTIAAAAKSPLTFVTVANRSGMASTAMSSATPAAGTPTLANTGASSRKPPFGTPGVAKLSTTDDATTVRYSLTPNGTPYRRARNIVPVSQATAFATLNDDTASGKTNPACDGGTPRRPAE